MAYTTIDKPTDYFNIVLYTGNGSTQSITGVGFQPDWVWIKGRSVIAGHNLHDVVRGVNKQLYTNTTDAEETLTTLVTSFDSDGFSLGSNGNANSNTNTFVAWNWLASNTTASNTDGSITSTVSANQTAGFSIVSFTGTGANATVGHGLGLAPRMMIFKNRDEGAEGWFVYHESVGNTKRAGLLNETSAPSTSSTFFQDTSPTSSVFSVGSNHGVNGPDAMICYCFAEKKGYSKFGSYTGNGNADGTFVYTGFKPAWVMAKRTGTAGQNWEIHDNKRPEYNSSSKRLWANLTNTEATEDPYLDLVSNGFKIKTSDTNYNASDSYIYMAFAENPFVTSTGIPCTAR